MDYALLGITGKARLQAFNILDQEGCIKDRVKRQDSKIRERKKIYHSTLHRIGGTNINDKQ